MQPADALQAIRSLGLDPPIPADADPDVLLSSVRQELARHGLLTAAAPGRVEFAGFDVAAPHFSPCLLMVSRGTVTLRTGSGAPILETKLQPFGHVPVGVAALLAMAAVTYADSAAARLGLLAAIAALYALGAVYAVVSLEGWISGAVQRGCARPDWAPQRLP